MAYLGTEDGRFEKSTFDAGSAGEEASWLLRGLEKTTSIVLDDSHAYIATGCNILQASR